MPEVEDSGDARVHSAAAGSPGSRPRRSFRIGIAARLGLGFAAAACLTILVNHITQRTSDQAALRVAQVQAGYEPLVQNAQQLTDALADFERAVFDHVDGGASLTAARIDESAARLEAAVAAYQELATRRPVPLEPTVLDGAVRAYDRHAREIVQLVRQRRELVRRYWTAFDALDAELELRRAAAPSRTSTEVVARRSVSELASALDDLADRFGNYIAFTGEAAAREVTARERAFRMTLDRHAEDLAAMAGQAWLDDLRRDFEGLIGSRRALVSLNDLLTKTSARFVEAGASLANTIRSGLSEPARLALAGAATDANASALEARSSVARVSFMGLAVLFVISVATVVSVIVPVRRLTRAVLAMANDGERRPVARGGVRELDELAAAFNHMVERLARAERIVRGYQMQLEARVEERTRQLQHMAHHDPLTDLPNRRQLFAYLEEALAEATGSGRRVGLLFLDLDNFKTINDSLGHEFGDRVLQAVGDRLRCAVVGQGFSARLGGDEFTMVCEGAGTVEEVEAIAAGMLGEFQQPVLVSGRELTIGVSIGASVFPDHAGDTASLLRAADAALFRAKDLGRNRYSIFSKELLDLAAERFQTEQALRRAIEAGEFELVYQPEVCFETGRVSSVEALLRWRRAGNDPVAPAEFLCVAEQSGLMAEISAWVLDSAIGQAADWYRGGWADVRVAVNVSSQQLLEGGLVERVRALLDEHGLPATGLELELTENVLQTAPGTVEVLQKLRELGVSVALDDFGTGYSSLTSLEQLPLDRIKIDRSLVTSVDTNARSAAIVRSIVGLSRSLGLRVTAEGVERIEQLAFLLAFRGLDVQGFLISRPVDAGAVASFAASAGPKLEDLLLDAPEAAFDPNATGSMVVRHLKAAATSSLEVRRTPPARRRRKSG
jgi:diguanylate cyclase (GGDEF)-like protein